MGRLGSLALALVLFGPVLGAGSLGLPLLDDLVPKVGVAGVGVATLEPVTTILDPLLPSLLKERGPQIAILVLDPALESQVLSTLRLLGLDYHLYDQLHQVALVLPLELLDTVLRIEGVLSVWRNEVMQPYLDHSTAYVGARLLWNTYRVRGEGVTVLVVDSGIDGDHPDLKYGAKLLENVVPTRQSNALIDGYKEGVRSSDSDGHGTHVASIVAGSGFGAGPRDADRGKYRGVAYEAKLVGFQAGITDRQGEIRFESVTVLEAFNYALSKQRTFNIRVVSNSWGTNGAFEPSNPINQATFNMYKAGMFVTFAAGNEGGEGPGSLNKYCVAPWVLCVGGGDFFNRVTSFSSYGTDPKASGLPYDHADILAPSVGIGAARADGASGHGLYASKSGTSMAAPHVAGVAALLLSDNPRLSPDNVMDILTASADPIAGEPVWRAGAGYLNALDAYRMAQDVPGDLAQFIRGHVKYGGKATGDPDHSEDAVTVGLGRGKAKAVSGADISPIQFLQDLVTTPHGLVFLIGSAVLSVLTFGFDKPAYARLSRREPKGGYSTSTSPSKA
jgi:serine protease AprX